MVLGLFGSLSKVLIYSKDKLYNQHLLIKRWSSNGIREDYHEWLKRLKIPAPPRSIDFKPIKVQRRKGDIN